ncbi:MAG: ATP-binding protein [Armatimonadota bacterium]
MSGSRLAGDATRSRIPRRFAEASRTGRDGVCRPRPLSQGRSSSQCLKSGILHDTGEGLPEVDLARTYYKFSQVEAYRAGQTMSIGLKLAFVKIAVEAHGGKVRVESELGKGSTFHVSLPALSPNASEVSPARSE